MLRQPGRRNRIVKRGVMTIWLRHSPKAAARMTATIAGCDPKAPGPQASPAGGFSICAMLRLAAPAAMEPNRHRSVAQLTADALVLRGLHGNATVLGCASLKGPRRTRTPGALLVRHVQRTSLALAARDLAIRPADGLVGLKSIGDHREFARLFGILCAALIASARSTSSACRASASMKLCGRPSCRRVPVGAIERVAESFHGPDGSDALSVDFAHAAGMPPPLQRSRGHCQGFQQL